MLIYFREAKTEYSNPYNNKDSQKIKMRLTFSVYIISVDMIPNNLLLS